MSRADREKWDERYRAGAFAERRHPSVLLRDWVDRLPPGRALDLACGAGRNSIFLARRKFAVTGIDISATGLERARLRAAKDGFSVNWLQHDLDEALSLRAEFQVVCLFRYMNRELIRRLPDFLAPGGILLVEEHLRIDENAQEIPLAGPSNPAFLAAPGELRALLAGMEVLQQEEGIVIDPDGRHVALARLIGRKPRSSTANRHHSRFRKSAPSS